MTDSETWPFVLQEIDYKSSLSTELLQLSNINVSERKTDSLNMNNSACTVNCLWPVWVSQKRTLKSSKPEIVLF